MKRRDFIGSLGALSISLALGSRAEAGNEQGVLNAWSALDPAALKEFPSGNPDVMEVWLYSDQMSYAAGDEVIFYVHTTAESYSLSIQRDGASPKEVFTKTGLKGMVQKTAETAYRTGARWKESFRLKIPPDWPGGVYVVTATIGDDKKGYVEAGHFFVLREKQPGKRSKIAIMLCTSTYIAYNDWAGANYYRSIKGGKAIDVPEPILSTQRPWARGFARLPMGAPRHGKDPKLKPFEDPRYPFIEWAITHGYSRHYLDAGWAHWERNFVVWAEKEGFELEYLTQHDLHYSPKLLDNYNLLVIVGHDEYWTWEMRDAVDRFIERGGNIARFAGNFLWQVRFESDGAAQVCYKVASKDPYHEGEKKHLTTTLWDHPVVNRPAAQTMGLTGAAGVYHRVGGASPRGSGGFTVYRPEHWVFNGTDLYYGDVFGEAPTSIVSFEVDGLDYTFRDGLPYPTFKDGAPQSTEILAMTPAIKGEEDRSRGKRPLLASLVEFEHLNSGLDGDRDSGLRSKYGSAMITVHTRSKGTCVNAGTASWVNGLRGSPETDFGSRYGKREAQG